MLLCAVSKVIGEAEAVGQWLNVLPSLLPPSYLKPRDGPLPLVSRDHLRELSCVPPSDHSLEF